MRQRGKKSCNRFCVCCEYKEPSTSLNRKTHGARFYDMEVFAIRSSVQAFLFPKKLQRPDFHDASTLTVSVHKTDTCGIRNLLFI